MIWSQSQNKAFTYLLTALTCHACFFMHSCSNTINICASSILTCTTVYVLIILYVCGIPSTPVDSFPLTMLATKSVIKCLNILHIYLISHLVLCYFMSSIVCRWSNSVYVISNILLTSDLRKETLFWFYTLCQLLLKVSFTFFDVRYCS